MAVRAPVLAARALFGPVVAWNVLLLATIVAAGVLTFLWLRALDLGPVGAFAGGLAFAIAPYRLAQSSEHLLGWISVLIPLILLGVERARAAGPAARHTAGAPWQARPAWRASRSRARCTSPSEPFPSLSPMRSCAAAAWPLPGSGRALAAAGIGLAIRYTLISGSTERAAARSRRSASSAEPLDVLSRWRLDGLEDFVYVGWLTPLLAAVGAVLLWRSGRSGLAVVLGIRCARAAAPGPRHQPPALRSALARSATLRYPRVPGRLMPIADLAIAALLAVTVARLVAAAGGARPRWGWCCSSRPTLPSFPSLTLLPIKTTKRTPRSGRSPGPPARATAVRPQRPLRKRLRLLRAPGAAGAARGYSTLAPQPAFDFFFLRNRLSCGVWLPGDESALLLNGIDLVAFHRGMYEQGEVPGAWFGWRGLAGTASRPRRPAAR